jgi:hypothetical protein
MNELLQCPFCGGTDFDNAGLKSHLLNGGCDVFNETENIERLFNTRYIPEPKPVRIEALEEHDTIQLTVEFDVLKQSDDFIIDCYNDEYDIFVSCLEQKDLDACNAELVEDDIDQ